MPPALASRFTQAELAALAVIARQCQRDGACSLPIDAIAALAGVSSLTPSPGSPVLCGGAKIASP
jgi:hypothetical protein